MHSVVHVNLHCRVASSHLHRPRANVERDVHFKKELDFLIYMRETLLIYLPIRFKILHRLGASEIDRDCA